MIVSLVEPMFVSSATSCTDWPWPGEFVLMDTVKFQMPLAMDVRNGPLTSDPPYPPPVCVEVLVVVDSVYGLQGFVVAKV